MARGSPKREKPVTVLLVRHGQTPTTGEVLPGRAPGLGLSDRGLAQAEAVAARVAANSKVAAVYASPLQRARETAAPIARSCKLRVRTAAGLNECDFGDWTGRALKELRNLPEWRRVQRTPSTFRFPGGESFAEMQLRVNDCIQALCARHPGDTIVAVSHADVIKAALAQALGTHLDLFQRIVVSPCSLSAVTYADDGPIVLTVNGTA